MTFRGRLEAKYVFAMKTGDEGFHWEWDKTHYMGELKMQQGGKEVVTVAFWKSPSSKSTLHLNYVGVPKEFRRGGMATKALKYLKKKAKAEGFREVDAEITWTGAYQMMKGIFGKPTYIADAIREFTEEELLEKLPNKTPENEKGMIEDAAYLEVVWNIK